MNITRTCPKCDYTLIGDEPSIEVVCEVCKLADTISDLSVKDLWKVLDELKLKEKQGNYTYSGIKQRLFFKETV